MGRKSRKKRIKGIRRFKPGQDFSDLFPEDEAGMSGESGQATSRGSQSAGRCSRDGDGDFEKMLEASLRGKGADAIMRAKKERGRTPAVPLQKRLKRYPPSQATLDLHGYTADMGRSRTENYIRSARERGIFTLTIVVGKGIHSDFGPVLPGVVEDLLVRMKRDGAVLAFEWEKKKKKRSGAVIVYLNQFND